jgi:hypothetical protein
VQKPVLSSTTAFYLTIQQPNPPSNSHIFATPEMSDQSGSARFHVLFQASLKEYEKQMDITLAKHPLTEKFQHCDSVESVAAIFQEQVPKQVPASSEFRGGERIIKSLNSTVSVLCALSINVNLILVRPKMPMESSMSLILILQLSPFLKAIYVGLAILIGVCPLLLFPRAYM